MQNTILFAYSAFTDGQIQLPLQKQCWKTTGVLRVLYNMWDAVCFARGAHT